MKINLQEDAAKILDYIRQRVKDYDPETSGGPGDGETVYQIDIGYAHTQWGFLALVFDTRPDAEPDGEWNSYIEDSSLEMPHWEAAFEALCEEKPIEFTHRDGRTKKITEYPGDERYAEYFGEMLKELLLEARDAGVFADLPTAEVCSLGIEEHDGRYGWPMYKDRGKPETTL